MTIQIIPSHPSADGAGVKIQRVHGFQNNGLDPFLMLDEILSDNPDDYGSGFPAHPHRGIETLTYIRHGGFEHQDHLGNKGGVQSGEAQWMSAGRGIIHSEMPLQKDGLMHGFQLWLNLPASQKMKDPDWQDIGRDRLPWHPLNNAELKVIGGEITLDDTSFRGPLQQLPGNAAVADLCLKPDADLSLENPAGRTLLLYVYEGQLTLNGKTLEARQMAKITEPGAVQVASSKGAGSLLLSGVPLKEPVAHYGPFVMNTQAEINQAIRDYQTGTLTD